MAINSTHRTSTTTDHHLPNGFTLRPTRHDDVTPVTDLINACSMADVGALAQNEDEVSNDWGTPGFNLETDSRVILSPDNRIVGYSELWNISDPHVQSYIYFAVHPDFRTLGIADHLLHLCEVRARDYIPTVPAEARVSLRNGFNSRREDRKALAEREGFAYVRSFLQMRIEMDAPPPDPVWPEGISVRTLRNLGDDFHAAYLANDEAFKDHWGHLPISFDKWLHWVESDPDFDQTLYFLAVTDGPDGEEIAGVCFCRPKTTEDPGMGWIEDLSVRREWRRQGIAVALLNHAFGEFWRRGQQRVGLGVDATSLTGATELYEKVGMHAYRRYDTYEKELRPGVELSTQTLEG